MPVSPALAEEDDACEPLDLDSSVAYRFGALSDLTVGLHLSGLKIRNLSRPGGTVSGQPVRVSFEISPVHLEFGPIHFI
jgi:hypothetical protein